MTDAKEPQDVLEIEGEIIEGPPLLPMAPYDHRTLSPVETDDRPLALGGMAFARFQDQLKFARSVAQEMRLLATELDWLVDIRGSSKPHIKVAGWSTMLAMIGVVPVSEKVRMYQIEGYDVAEATVQLIRTRDGARVGRGIATCGAPDEKDRNGNLTWAERPRFVKVSMALTRATGKAARLSYAWIVEMAGYSPTPAEDMPGYEPESGSHGPIKRKRISNQWEQRVIDFLVGNQLVQAEDDQKAGARAREILNLSPLMDVPFGELEIVEAGKMRYTPLEGCSRSSG
jgi:hypothetical protein